MCPSAAHVFPCSNMILPTIRPCFAFQPTSYDFCFCFFQSLRRTPRASDEYMCAAANAIVATVSRAAVLVLGEKFFRVWENVLEGSGRTCLTRNKPGRAGTPLQPNFADSRSKSGPPALTIFSRHQLTR